jgi:transposase
MQVDWAGDPLYITDPVTGELDPAYIFVAVLPCSLYTYAEACSDMKMENWLLCHVHAFNYFGGVTRLHDSGQLQNGNYQQYALRNRC